MYIIWYYNVYHMGLKCISMELQCISYGTTMYIIWDYNSINGTTELPSGTGLYTIWDSYEYHLGM